jgi:hypothetical protein
MTPKAARLHPGHSQAADGHICPRFDMLAQHHLVIHLVDVVAGQDDRILDAIAVDDVDVLRHRIGRAAVPVHLVHPLACRQDIQVFVPLRPEEAPAALDVADEGVRLVLRRNRHLPDARVQRIRQRKVDDPGLAAKVDRRLGPRVRQLLQPAAAPPGKDKGHGLRG